MTDEKMNRKELQDIMTFLGAISAGMENEKSLGKTAIGVAFSAGEKMGKKYAENFPKTDDVLTAIENSKKMLDQVGFQWEFETWGKKSECDCVAIDEENNKVIKLVFRDCMIRQTLFRYGHPQKNSLCYTMYGFFSGLIGAIVGKQARLDVVHAGQNACLKKLVVGEMVIEV